MPRPPSFSMPDFDAYLTDTGRTYTVRRGFIRSVGKILGKVGNRPQHEEVRLAIMALNVDADDNRSAKTAWNAYAAFVGSELPVIGERLYPRKLSEDDWTARYTSCLLEIQRQTDCTLFDLRALKVGDVITKTREGSATEVLYAFNFVETGMRVALLSTEGLSKNWLAARAFAERMAKARQLVDEGMKEVYLFSESGNPISDSEFSLDLVETFYCTRTAVRGRDVPPNPSAIAPEVLALFDETEHSKRIRRFLSGATETLSEPISATKRKSRLRLL